jgi:integrase
MRRLEQRSCFSRPTANASFALPGAGVRQGSKRQGIPDILEVSELQAIVAELQLRKRVLVLLDMASGLRRGELAGIK